MRLTTIADSVIGALPCCDDPPLAIALLRALAGGDPVPDSQLAAATGRDEAQVTTALDRWPNVQRDAQGRIIAFSGLSQRPTAHRFELGERELFTSCAWSQRRTSPARSAATCTSSPGRTPPTTGFAIVPGRPR